MSQKLLVGAFEWDGDLKVLKVSLNVIRIPVILDII